MIYRTLVITIYVLHIPTNVTFYHCPKFSKFGNESNQRTKSKCIIPTSMDVHVAQETLPALFRLENYPKNPFSISQLKDSVLSQRWIHLSQTNEEEEENDLFDYMNEHWCDAKGGKLND